MKINSVYWQFTYGHYIQGYPNIDNCNNTWILEVLY